MPPKRSGVTGPTSALTSFLAEHGIRAPARAPRNEAIQEDGEPNGNAAADPSNSNAEAGPSSMGKRKASDADGIDADSETEDDEDSEVAPRAFSSRKKTKAVKNYDSSDLDSGAEESNLTDRQKKEKKLQKIAWKKQQLQVKYGGGNDDNENSEDDFKPEKKPAGKAGGGGPPKIGGFAMCGDCGKKFPVTKYSPPYPKDPDTLLCHVCAKKHGLANYKGPAKPPAAKRKVSNTPRKIVNYEEVKRVPRLTDICIQIIANHLDEVDELGDIGPVNMTKVNNIICKERKLNDRTAGLFYDISLSELRFNDATGITSSGYETLSRLCPTLTNLTLHNCGQLDTYALKAVSSLPLTRVELESPFLVTPEGWCALLEKPLESFVIQQSPRFDEDCLAMLCDKSKFSLKELGLSYIGNLTDEWLGALSNLESLTSLSLCNLPEVTPEAVIHLLRLIGSNLVHLDLSNNARLDDSVLLEGIVPYCPNLEFLSLRLLVELTSEGIAEGFKKWKESGHRGLTHLDLGDCYQGVGNALRAVREHSGATATFLSVKGWKDIEKDALEDEMGEFPLVKKMDLGWVRRVDDAVLTTVMSRSPVLKELSVWGCNLVTTAHPRRKALKIFGVESHIF